jgi:hypothetical protein
MPTKTADPTSAITDVFVTSIKQSQELAAAGLSAWVDFAGKAFAMPSLDSLPAGFAVVDPKEIIDVSFGLAEEVLATQKQLASKLVDAVIAQTTKTV